MKKNRLLLLFLICAGMPAMAKSSRIEHRTHSASPARVHGLVPLELILFTARADGNDVKLTWKTTMEQNNQGFNVEYSTDGSTWEQVGFVQGAGNSSSERDYQFIHLHPAAAMNYYRLEQVDFDENKNYGPVQAVAFERKKISVSFYPNPVTTTVFIQLNSTKDRFSAGIVDLTGRPVRDFRDIAGDAVSTLDIAGLKPGIYFLLINNLTSKTITEKFTLQKL